MYSSQCSTLMLIESAKDSFRFSVTHYKHPKQPHTVQVCTTNLVLFPCLSMNKQKFGLCNFSFAFLQAKTVEEKKLWAHHIKRLILENHHAIIPQKVGNLNMNDM